LLVAVVLVAAAPLAPGAAIAARSTATTKPARTACQLLTRAEITSVLTEAPLDPGPRPFSTPNTIAKLTRCRWDDRAATRSPELVAYTGLARDLSKKRLSSIGTAAAGSSARDLTADELAGIGDRGSVEIIRNGTYGSIAIVKGNHAVLVSAAYQGDGTLPQVTEADMIELARMASARV
jgi:hypothetical protein